MRSENAGSAAGLSAALDELAAADVAGLADDALRAEVMTLVSAGHRVHAELARRVEVFDRRGLARIDGFRSTRTWLQAFTRMSGAAAHRLVKQARLLARLPRLATAASSGVASAEHVGQVSRLVDQLRGGPAAGGDPVGAVAEADPVLAEAAAALDVAAFGLVCDRVRAHVDPDGPDPAAAFAARGLSLTPADAGLALRGQLDSEGGATLATALDAIMTPPTDDDERTAAQRRADALVELARRALTTDRLPTVGGQRPQVGVLLYPQALSPELLERLARAHRGTPAGQRFARFAAEADDTGGPTDPRPWWQATHWTDPPLLDHIGSVPPAVAQRIAYDADVWRLILDPDTGTPLDVGRSRRIIPHWMRRALHARDRGCRFPGCRTPAPWTDAHHLVPWAEGGATSLDNSLLLCRHHHGLIHEAGWQIQLSPATGQVTVTRPDGTRHAAGPRPGPGARAGPTAQAA